MHRLKLEAHDCSNKLPEAVTNESTAALQTFTPPVWSRSSILEVVRLLAADRYLTRRLSSTHCSHSRSIHQGPLCGDRGQLNVDGLD